MTDYRYAEIPVVERRVALRDVREGMFLVMPVAALDRDRSIRVSMRGSRRVEAVAGSRCVPEWTYVVLDNASRIYGGHGDLVDVLVPETDESDDE